MRLREWVYVVVVVINVTTGVILQVLESKAQAGTRK